MSVLVSSRLLTPAVPTGSMTTYDNTNDHNSHQNNTASLPKYFNVPFAIQQGYFRCIRYLLQLHYDPNERDSQLRTPLILCAYIENDRWSLSIAQNLLEKGAKIALEDHARRNAIHHACALQRLHLVQLYLNCLDFDINAKDCEGNTCLHYAAITGNSTIAELLMRSAEKVGIRLDEYFNREGYSPAALALKYGHIQCANQITHRDGDEFFVVPRPLSIYENSLNTDENQLVKAKIKKKSVVQQSPGKRPSYRPSSLSFGLLKIIFNDGDTNYSNRLAGLCQQAKQHQHFQNFKHNKQEAPQAAMTTISKFDRTKSTLLNGTLYLSTEAVVNETQSNKEHQKSFDSNGNCNNSNRPSPRTHILLKQNGLNKFNLNDQNSSFIQKTTSKTQLSVDELNLTKGNPFKTNDEETKLKVNKATIHTQRSHSPLDHSDNNNNYNNNNNNNNTLKTKPKVHNSTTSILNNPTFLHSSISQASTAKTKQTTILSASPKKKLSSNDHFDSIAILPKQNHSYLGSDSSTYSQANNAGRSLSALVQQNSNLKSAESTCSIREAKGRKCPYNKPEELFGLRPEELFAPEQYQPKIFDQNSSAKLNDSTRLKRNSLQKQKYIWQQDVDKIIDLYNVHHSANYRKPAVPPPIIPATHIIASNENNNESGPSIRPRRSSISKNSLVNSRSTFQSKQSVSTSVSTARRNSISRPAVKLTNG